MLVNPLEFVLRKAQVFQRLNVLLQLFRTARTYQHRRHAFIFEQPAQRHLRHGLPTRMRHFIQQAQAVQVGFGQHFFRQAAHLFAFALHA